MESSEHLDRDEYYTSAVIVSTLYDKSVAIGQSTVCVKRNEKCKATQEKKKKKLNGDMTPRHQAYNLLHICISSSSIFLFMLWFLYIALHSICAQLVCLVAGWLVWWLSAIFLLLFSISNMLFCLAANHSSKQPACLSACLPQSQRL